MFNIEHFLLFSFLFGLSFFLTKIPQKNYERNFWGAVAIFVIAYTIIVGLRYGWGHDYVRYEYSYNMLEYDYSKDYDLAYWNLYKIEKGLGLSFAGSVLLSTLLIIVSYFYIVKAMKGDKYMLMCFLPATLMTTTYAMRQFQAIAYINIAIGLLLSSDNILKKRKKHIIIAALLIFLAYHTHGSSISYAIPFLVCIIFRNIKPIPYTIAILAYLGTIMLADIIAPYMNNIFLSLIENISVTDHLQGYVNNADVKLFGADSVDEATFAYGGAFQIFHYISYVCLLYITGKSLKIKQNQNVTYIYNIVAIAILVQEVFFSQEMIRRLIDPFAILYFIPLGYAKNIYLENRRKKFKGYPLYGLCISILLLRIFYPFISFLTKFSMAGFVWD